MSICSILYIIVQAIKICLVLFAEAMELALELTKFVLKYADFKQKSPISK